MAWTFLLLFLALPCASWAVTLAWDFTPASGQSFIVARSLDGTTWADVATLPQPAQGTTMPWSDPALPPLRPLVVRYEVRSKVGTAESPHSNQVVYTEGGQPLLPQSAIVAAVADSQEMAHEQAPSSNVMDGNEGTMWHTAWSTPPAPPLPHTVVLDLGQNLAVDGLRYRPRTGIGNGTIADYEVAVSLDATTWGAPVRTGTWMWKNQTEEIVRFTPTVGRFVRLRALKEVNGNPWTSAAEVAVYAGPATVDRPPGQAISVTCAGDMPAGATSMSLNCLMRQP